VTDADDLLDDADLGEKARIAHSERRHRALPEGLAGDDRFVDDLDVEATIDTVHDGWVELELHWQGEATKRLPRRWDYHAEPITDAETRRARRQRWGRVIGKVLAFAIPAVLSIGFATVVMQRVSQSLTVNGQSVTEPTLSSTFLTVGPILIIAAIIIWGLSGGFPRGIGGGR
jgi:FlaG/FlaF family flagellin (archaellin)